MGCIPSKPARARGGGKGPPKKGGKRRKAADASLLGKDVAKGAEEAAVPDVARGGDADAGADAKRRKGKGEGPQKLSAAEVRHMTQKFAKSQYVGMGPTGHVYRASLDGREVAIKQLTSNSQTEEDFLEEVELVSLFRHKHVVRLFAFCPDAGSRALAFEFAPLGSLFHLLHGRDGAQASSRLTWAQRLSVLQGAAQGLEYLHHQLARDHPERADALEGLVHKRIKSANVLVFPGFLGKLADCKLQSPDQDSIIMEQSLPLGNFACEAPETFMSELTQKVDVYSFGIVLLEALSGRKPMQGDDKSGGATGQPKQSVREWAFSRIANGQVRQVVDPTLDGHSISDKVLQRYCKLASLCLESDPSRRPIMHIVSKTLLRLE